MEGAEEVGLVLARAAQLRSKLDRCIVLAQRPKKERGKNEQDGSFDAIAAEEEEKEEEEGEEEEEEEQLFDVRDALEALERQLSSLQALEQQQIYEKEAALAQIDRCRVFLQSKIRQCKGDFDVIQELSKFAGANSEEEDGHGDGLLLPPYSGLVPEAIFLDGLSSSRHLPKAHKLVLSNGPAKNSTPMVAQEDRSEAESMAVGLVRRAGSLLRFTVKSAAMVAGVLSILGMAGLEPRFVRRTDQLEPETPVLSNRVLVKERVEVPFGSVDQTPVVTWGLG